MNLLFASDSFKGSLSSEKIIDILTDAAKTVFGDCSCRGVLMADGGEGTLDAVIKETGGRMVTIKAAGPLFEEVDASYGILSDGGALVEMARASGLPLVEDDKRNPMNATSYGTGQMIKDAIYNDCKNITVSLGGSATNDGGIGAMRALGAVFYDREGNELLGIGSDLIKIHTIDVTKLKELTAGVKFTVMCDVISPLLGEKGATYTFGAQKGANLDMQKELENGMENYANVIKNTLSKDVSYAAGGGAAGGLGAALMAFLDAELKSGIETILDLLDFDTLLDGVSLVVTGEGRIDSQSAQGKVVSGVAKRAKRAGIPTVAIVGGICEGYETIYDAGISSVMPTVNGVMTLDKAMGEAEKLYKDAAIRMFRLIDAGMKIK